MAADSKIIIDLELRKEQAEQRLRQFEQRAAQQLERLQIMQARYAANPTPFVRNQLNASRGAYGRRLDDVQAVGAQLQRLQFKIDEESARKGGRLFGMQVNKQTSAFVKQFLGAYAAGELMNLGFAAMYTPNANNAGLRKAQATAEGAVTGGQIGAAFGPYGAAIGVATGALLSLSSAIIKERKEIEAEKHNRTNSSISQRIDSGRNIQNEAFERVMSYSARPARIARLQRRLKELESGKGDFSIASLDKQLNALENEGDHESAHYNKLKDLRERALSEKTQLQSQLFREAMTPYYKHSDVSQFADSRAKQGLYSGRAVLQRAIDKEGNRNIPINGIDFRELNNPVVNELRKIRSYLERVATTADKNGADNNAVQAVTRGAVFGIGLK